MDRKQQILDVAETLVRQRGFDGFSYADIEQQIGIRKASIHHHFPSKAELSDALVTRYQDRVLGRFSAIESRRGRAGDRLADYIALYRAALNGGEQLCLCVSLSAGRDSLSDLTLDQLNSFNAASVRWLQGVFALGAQDGSIDQVADPALEAAATLALMEGAQLTARAARDELKFEAATALLRARITLS